jgi:hypothetical protein
MNFFPTKTGEYKIQAHTIPQNFEEFYNKQEENELQEDIYIYIYIYSVLKQKDTTRHKHTYI